MHQTRILLDRKEVCETTLQNWDSSLDLRVKVCPLWWHIHIPYAAHRTTAYFWRELLSLRQAPKSYKLKLLQVCYVTCVINRDYISGLILFQQFQGEYCFEKVLCYPSQRSTNPIFVGGYCKHHSGIQQELDRIFRLQDKSQLLKLKLIVLFCCLGTFFLTCTTSEISSFALDWFQFGKLLLFAFTRHITYISYLSITDSLLL